MTYEVDGTSELLECIDILMAKVLHVQALEEWSESGAGLSEIPIGDFTASEYQTALWQTAELALTLLQDHFWALGEVEALHQALGEATTKLPSLYGPDGQALA